MIQLRRAKLTPPTLREGGKGGAAAGENHRRYAEDSAAPLDFEPHWCEPDVRGALYAMQGWVCAYCQRKIDPRDTKYVDHFRPKNGGYWWLAYVFENYFLTCGLCNVRKGDRFPVAEGSRRTTYETRDRLSEEVRLLIDPVADPVGQWLCVGMDDELETYGNVVARSDEPEFAECIRRSIDLFELNSDDDHLQNRVRLIEELTKAHRAGKLEKLKRRASRYRPHPLTTRSFLEAFAPELLPDAESELRWFIKKLCERLKSAQGSRTRRGSASGSIKRRTTEISWTLAFLWRDPPVGTVDDVARYLDEMECRGFVERYYGKLGEVP